MPKFAKGNNSKKKQTFFQFSPGYLLIIFYQLTEFEATCRNSFWDILITSFQCKKFATGNNSKKWNNFFLNFHQIIYSLSSITRPSLMPKAAIVFDISWLQHIIMAKNLQRPITQKKKKLFFQFSPYYLLIILYFLTKFEAQSCYSFRDILITKYHYDSLKGA